MFRTMTTSNDLHVWIYLGFIVNIINLNMGVVWILMGDRLIGLGCEEFKILGYLGLEIR